MIVKFECEYEEHKQLLPDSVYWDASIGCATIKDKYSSHYKKAEDDLKKLKGCGILPIKPAGYFGRVKFVTEKYGGCFIYQHKEHAMCSNVTLSKLSFMTQIEETHNYVEHHCRVHRSHYNFSPYFVGDYALERVENSLKEKGDDDRVAEVNKYRKRAILRETKYNAFELVENDWTQCLQKCLEYPGFNIMFTATLGNRHSEVWRSRLPVQFDENVFLFHGVPDLVVRRIDCDEMVLVDSVGNAEEDSDGDSLRLEMSQKNESSYLGGSALIEKVGELVASIHMSLVCKVLRNVCSGEQFSIMKGHGLLVHRSTAIVHIEVTLSEDILHVRAVTLAEGIQEEIMCQCFEYLLQLL